MKKMGVLGRQYLIVLPKNLDAIKYIKYQVWNYVERKWDLSQAPTTFTTFTTFLYKECLVNS